MPDTTIEVDDVIAVLVRASEYAGKKGHIRKRSQIDRILDRVRGLLKEGKTVVFSSEGITHLGPCCKFQLRAFVRGLEDDEKIRFYVQ